MKHARWLLVLVNVLFVVATVVARIFNFGWLTIAGLFTLVIPAMGLFHFVGVMLLAFRKPLTTIHVGLLLLTNVLWLLVAILLPDGGDTGTYAVFGLIPNPPAILNTLGCAAALIAIVGDVAIYGLVIFEAAARKRQPAG